MYAKVFFMLTPGHHSHQGYTYAFPDTWTIEVGDIALVQTPQNGYAQVMVGEISHEPPGGHTITKSLISFVSLQPLRDLQHTHKKQKAARAVLEEALKSRTEDEKFRTLLGSNDLAVQDALKTLGLKQTED